MRKYKTREENEEGQQVELMERELKGGIRYMREFASKAVEWSKTITTLMGCLRNWALSFGRVIGLNEDSQSEAFDAFLVVVEEQLLVLCQHLEEVIKAYEHFFFHYTSSDLLIVNTSEIDFVERNEDLQQLLRKVSAPIKGTQYFLPLGNQDAASA